MRYQCVTADGAKRFVNALATDSEVDLDDFVSVRGEGPEIDLSEIYSIAARIESDDEDDVELVEQKFSKDVYEALRSVDVEVRDDLSFWRFLTLGPLFNFFLRRNTASQRAGLAGVGGNPSDVLALRMFLRGQVARESSKKGDKYELAMILGQKSHDFWQSHVFRTPTGSQPLFAHELIRIQSRKRWTTDPLREFVRDFVNRPKALIAANLFEEDECSKYLSSQVSEFEELRSNGDNGKKKKSRSSKR
jgi:hypothetical protein